MLKCFAAPNANAVPIIALTNGEFVTWLNAQSSVDQQWIKALNFSAKPETFCIVPNADGSIKQVVLGLKNAASFGMLPLALPANNYYIQNITDADYLTQSVLAWGMGAYQFTRYKVATKNPAQLIIPEQCAAGTIENIIDAIHWGRDLINTPTEDMGPPELADAAKIMAQKFSANVSVITGQDLLKNNYPTIHAVGRASNKSPCLIDLRWGNSQAPKITLVGKGVCFDTGGLDLKNAANMLIMKKDMGGAAHALALAQMIMQANLPVCLRVLIPAVENAVAGNAYRPGDVIKTRKGLTVEISDTDAEGRLVLCDALAEAVTEKPDLLLDFATLTGAARIAVGTDISALFSNNDELAQQLLSYGQQQQDPIWRLPLHSAYRKMLDSPIADIKNSATSAYAGAITAGLFLKEFVPDDIAWAHFDLMAWNLVCIPGHPEGGEIMALRAVFKYLGDRFVR